MATIKELTAFIFSKFDNLNSKLDKLDTKFKALGDRVTSLERDKDLEKRVSRLADNDIASQRSLLKELMQSRAQSLEDSQKNCEASAKSENLNQNDLSTDSHSNVNHTKDDSSLGGDDITKTEQDRISQAPSPNDNKTQYMNHASNEINILNDEHGGKASNMRQTFEVQQILTNEMSKISDRTNSSHHTHRSSLVLNNEKPLFAQEMLKNDNSRVVQHKAEFTGVSVILMPSKYESSSSESVKKSTPAHAPIICIIEPPQKDDIAYTVSKGSKTSIVAAKQNESKYVTRKTVDSTLTAPHISQNLTRNIQGKPKEDTTPTNDTLCHRPSREKKVNRGRSLSNKSGNPSRNPTFINVKPSDSSNPEQYLLNSDDSPSETSDIDCEIIHDDDSSFEMHHREVKIGQNLKKERDHPKKNRTPWCDPLTEISPRKSVKISSYPQGQEIIDCDIILTDVCHSKKKWTEEIKNVRSRPKKNSKCEKVSQRNGGSQRGETRLDKLDSPSYIDHREHDVINIDDLQCGTPRRGEELIENSKMKLGRGCPKKYHTITSATSSELKQGALSGDVERSVMKKPSRPQKETFKGDSPYKHVAMCHVKGRRKPIRLKLREYFKDKAVLKLTRCDDPLFLAKACTKPVTEKAGHGTKHDDTLDAIHGKQTSILVRSPKSNTTTKAPHFDSIKPHVSSHTPSKKNSGVHMQSRSRQNEYSSKNKITINTPAHETQNNISDDDNYLDLEISDADQTDVEESFVGKSEPVLIEPINFPEEREKDEMENMQIYKQSRIQTAHKSNEDLSSNESDNMSDNVDISFIDDSDQDPDFDPDGKEKEIASFTHESIDMTETGSVGEDEENIIVFRNLRSSPKRGAKRKAKRKQAKAKSAPRNSDSGNAEAICGQKRFKCTKCTLWFDTRIAYLRHTSLRHRSKSNISTRKKITKPLPHKGTKCKKCGVILSSPREIHKHYLEHRGKVYCSICDASFANHHLYEQHCVIHNKPARFQCWYCEERFFRKAQRDKHQQSHGIEHALFTCSVCDSRFQTRLSLDKHLSTHPGQEPYKCDYCEQRFSFIAMRNTHERTHSAHLMTYACEHCGRLFNTPSLRQRHIDITHIKIALAEFICKHCGKKYTTERSLNDHEILHTDDKPFKCDICGERFRYLAFLKGHEFDHKTGFVRYQCGHCGRRFKSQSARNKHVRKCVSKKAADMKTENDGSVK